MPRLLSGKVILYLFFLLILDVCVMPAFGSFRPVLSYLWILYVAFHIPGEVIPAAIFVGILRDLVGSQPLGVETTSLVTLAIGILFAMQKLEHEFFFTRMTMTFVFCFLTLFMNLILSHSLTGIAFSGASFLSCVVAAAMTALVMPFFFYITGKWFGFESRFLRQYELFS